MTPQESPVNPVDRLTANLNAIRERIATAAARSGRDADDVTLVAVTKTVAAGTIAILPQTGVLDVGENRLQVATPKIDVLGPEFRWHFIGPLQRNKARKAVDRFSLIHSLASGRLLDTLDRLGGERGSPVDVLVQVNISAEDKKQGIEPESVKAFLHVASDREWVRIRGLMGMAPYVADPDETRPCFSRLRRIRDEANRDAWYRIPLAELSMGMTNDFEIAVEEGATIVRVGTAVFRGVDPDHAADDPPTKTEER
jgi:pyridoxal phosphate enzyme (YggS family)